MDRLVERFMDLAGSDATLVLATALSQQPCTSYDGAGARRFSGHVSSNLYSISLLFASRTRYNP